MVKFSSEYAIVFMLDLDLLEWFQFSISYPIPNMKQLTYGSIQTQLQTLNSNKPQWIIDHAASILGERDYQLCFPWF